MDESGLLFAFCLLCALRARPCGGCARIFNVRNGPCVNIGSGMTCITSVEILQVDLPPPVPRSDAIQSFVMQETPIVRLQMDDGGAATGYSYTIGTGGSSVVALPKDHLAPRLIGRDPSCIEAIWHDLMFATHATTVGEEPLPAAAPAAAWLEYIPQLDAVVSSRLVIEAGVALAPDSPGLGIVWRQDELDRRARARHLIQ